MLQHSRRIVRPERPDVLPDARAVHLCDERPDGPAKQIVSPLAEVTAVGLTDKRENAIRTPAAHEALILHDAAMSRVIPGAIHGGSRRGQRAPELGELPADVSELGHKLLVGLVFVPHAPSLSPCKRTPGCGNAVCPSGHWLRFPARPTPRRGESGLEV